jgi:hypothetical protein
MALKMNYAVYLSTISLLLSAVLLSGCISSQSTYQDKPLPLVTPDPTQVRTIVTTATPITTETPLLQQTTAANRTETITTDLLYGITISYPQDWILEETGVNVTRDYGRDVINVANLYSPAIPSGRKMAGLNPDTSDNTVLTVDVDEAGATDFEGYFNHVTVALQDEYGKIDITRHNLQLKISGYKAYQMDFDAKDLRGTYIFTKVDGTVYIFAFSNPTPYSSEVEAIYRSIIISP